MNNPQPLANCKEEVHDHTNDRASWAFFIIIVILIVGIMTSVLVRHTTSAQPLNGQQKELGRESWPQEQQSASGSSEGLQQPKAELTELAQGDTLTKIILYENCKAKLLFTGPTSTTVTVLYVKSVFCEPDYKFRDGKVFYGNGSLFMD
jgi:hypothetical protein